MRIIETKDYNDMSKKSSEYFVCTGDHETGLCTGTGNRFHTDRYI